MFNFLQKKQKERENQAVSAEQQAEAMARAKKLEAFIIEVMKVAVKHDVSVSDFKVLLHEVSRQLETAFDSRKVTDFMDKDEVAKTVEEQKPVEEVPVESGTATTTEPIVEPAA